MVGRRWEPMYEVLFTLHFLKATKKEDAALLKQAIEEILANPYIARNSHLLAHEWAGFRAADFIRGKRIIYRICDECVQRHHEGLRPLACCEQPSGNKNVVTFVDFGDYHANAGRRRLRPASEYRVRDETEPKSSPEDQS